MTKHLHILLSNTSHWGSQGYTTTAFNYFVLYFYFLFIYFCWKWKKTHHWYADILHQKDSISPVSHRPCPFCKKGVASQHVRILYVTEWQSYQGHLLTLTAVEVSHARLNLQTFDSQKLTQLIKLIKKFLFTPYSLYTCMWLPWWRISFLLLDYEGIVQIWVQSQALVLHGSVRRAT